MRLRLLKIQVYFGRIWPKIHKSLLIGTHFLRHKHHKIPLSNIDSRNGLTPCWYQSNPRNNADLGQIISQWRTFIQISFQIQHSKKVCVSLQTRKIVSFMKTCALLPTFSGALFINCYRLLFDWSVDLQLVTCSGTGLICTVVRGQDNSGILDQNCICWLPVCTRHHGSACIIIH